MRNAVLCFSASLMSVLIFVSGFLAGKRAGHSEGGATSDSEVLELLDARLRTEASMGTETKEALDRNKELVEKLLKEKENYKMLLKTDRVIRYANDQTWWPRLGKATRPWNGQYGQYSPSGRLLSKETWDDGKLRHCVQLTWSVTVREGTGWRQLYYGDRVGAQEEWRDGKYVRGAH